MDDPTEAGQDEFIVIVFPGAAGAAAAAKRMMSALSGTCTGQLAVMPSADRLTMLARGKFERINAALHAELGNDERHLLLQIGRQREAAGLGAALAWLQSPQRVNCPR